MLPKLVIDNLALEAPIQVVIHGGHQIFKIKAMLVVHTETVSNLEQDYYEQEQAI